MNTIRILHPIRREHIAIAGIVLLSLALSTIHLDREGFGNLYYAAGVKSMLLSRHNFFYLAYDPGGFVTIDKPPLGFWLQAASAALFGYHGWALMLPQIVAAVLSVFVLYRLVGKVFGTAAGLTSALIMAVTPISVAAARNNTIDSTLVLAELVAFYMLYKASEENGGLRWTLASAAMIGIGFNIKMMEAYLVLPAFGFFLLLAPRLTRLQKMKHLSLAAILMTAVSLSWAIWVDLTPAGQRPYVGSTQHNSVLELALQHNAADRFAVGSHADRITAPDAVRAMPVAAYVPMDFAGKIQPVKEDSAVTHALKSLKKSFWRMGSGPGPWRMFSSDLGGEVGWFLPLALLGGAALLWKAPLFKTAQLNLRQRAALFWLAWLLPMTVFFSFATLFHRYYTVMMVPAIAALSGIVLLRLWRAAFRSMRSGLLLVAVFAAMTLYAIYIASGYSAVRFSLICAISGFMVISLLAFAAWLRRRGGKRPISLGSLTVASGMLALLAGPVVWAATPAVYGSGGSDPVAGPELVYRHSANPQSVEENRLSAYLEAHYVSGSFLAATPSAETSSPIIIDTGLPVMTMGGYSGSDPILSNKQLETMITHGKVKYFVLPQTAIIDHRLQYADWIRQHCRLVADFSFPADKSKPSVALYQFRGN